MPWYGGQNGAQRLRSRTQLSEAFGRFRSSLGQVDCVNFTSTLVDNDNFDSIKLLMHNPSTQEEIIEMINKKKATSEGPLALAIPFSHHLRDLSGVEDSICERLRGLFVFGAVNVKKAAMLDFLQRCPHIKSLTLAGMDEMNDKFLQQILQEKLVKELEVLEVSNASDDAVAAMVSAPNLRKIVFRWPDPSITNDGFERLVEAGGAQNLVAIAAGTLKKDLSKTLSVNFLQHILPKFVAGHGRDLEHISVGKMYKPKSERDAEALGLMPPSRMRKDELIEAFRDRGLSVPTPETVANMRRELEAIFDIDEVVAIDKKKQADKLESSGIKSLQSEAKSIEKKISILQSKPSGHLYQTLNVSDLKNGMHQCRRDSGKMKRDELAVALDKLGYRGGGKPKAQIKYYNSELARLESEIKAIKAKIAALRLEAKNLLNKKKSKAKTVGDSKVAGTKRPLANVANAD